MAGQEILTFLKGEQEGVTYKKWVSEGCFFLKSSRIFSFTLFFLEQDRCSFGKLDHWTQLFHHLGESDPHPLEKGMATHSSILAWRLPWIGESGRL